MSAATEQSSKQGGSWFSRLSTKWKVAVVFGGMVAVALIINVLAPSAGRNNEFKPQNEFKLEPWINLKIGPVDMSINRAVFYLFLASALTVGTMIYIARRMQDKPNRVQTAVEAAYDLTKNIAGGNMDGKMATRWFPFVATLFFFIWWSNMIGYLPLPTSHETVDIFGVAVPSLAIYAATANLSIPLVLALIVWLAYHYEGVRTQGVRGYIASWIPAGVTGFARFPIFLIEAISQFVRLISLSVRLFANILAGHLLILFMAGGLVVLLGIAALGVFTLPMAIVFFAFEIVLIATLQAFIFATLTSIYLGGATTQH
ncbi:MAG: F-type H+-transporting ATPase subunit a [Gaiellaceae bacterium]|nr:F-type H+-transporting ATPase subunit a [Gaiellaceae bacterium]